MTTLLLVALAHGAARAPRAIAVAAFATLLAGGALLYRRLGARAEAEESEALLEAEFTRLEEPSSGIPLIVQVPGVPASGAGEPSTGSSSNY